MRATQAKQALLYTKSDIKLFFQGNCSHGIQMNLQNIDLPVVI